MPASALLEGWKPTDKSTTLLKSWWRMDNVTTSGAAITTVLDKSGNSNTATFASGRRGNLVSSALNGRPGLEGIVGRTVRGDATSVQTFDPAAEFSLVMIFKSATDANADFTQLLTLKNTTTNFALYTVNNLAGYNALNFGLSGGNQIGIATYVTTAAHILAIDYTGGGVTTAGNWRVWKNGVLQTLTTSSTSGNTGTTSIGEAAASSKSINASGQYYDIWCYVGSGSLLTASDLKGIGNYGFYQYGL